MIKQNKEGIYIVYKMAYAIRISSKIDQNAYHFLFWFQSLAAVYSTVLFIEFLWVAAHARLTTML